MNAQAQAHSFRRGMPRFKAALAQVTSSDPPEILEGDGCALATWSKDGRRIAFVCMVGSDIAFLAIEGDGVKCGEPPVSIPRLQGWIRWVEGGERPEGEWKTVEREQRTRGE